MMLSRKRCETFDFNCLFNNGFRTAIKNASNLLHACYSFGADIRNSHANKWLMLFDKCLAGSVFFVGLWVHSNIFPHFFLSPECIIL